MPELRPYQAEAVERMVAARRQYLAFAPRMGKTPVTVTVANRLGAERPLVICPAVARDVWRAHWRTWGLPDVRPRVLSYDELVRRPELEAELTTWLDFLVIDEVHYAAHVTAKRTNVAMRIANRAPNARGLYVLSGSPVRNRPFDLYPPLRAIWPDLLKRYGVLHAANFRAAFEREIEYYTPGSAFARERVEAQNVPALRALLDRLMIRTTREQVAEQLPPLSWETVPLELPRDVFADMARALERVEGYRDILDALRRGEIPGESRAHVATVRRILGTAKAYPAAKLVSDELDAGLLRHVVIGVYHLDVLDVLEATLTAHGTVRIDGSATPHQRAHAIHAFQAGDVPVMLAQLTAAGVSIDLSRADDVILVEQDWVPDVNVQFADRIRSPNKDRPCAARVLAVPDSIDSAVAAICRRKWRTAGRIVYGDD
jgi:SNF2 family DNA or RNA helicase